MTQINRRHLLSGAAALASSSALAQPTKKRPNIILLLADDLGWGEVSYQNPTSLLRTPNIDALASAGAVYSDAHSPSSVCTPTRYGILTGQYCWRTRLKRRVLWPYGAPLMRDRATIASVLKDSGYATAAVGKWHLGLDWPRLRGSGPEGMADRWSETTIDFSQPIKHGPVQTGFDSFFGVDAPGFPPYAFIEDNHIVGPPPSIRVTDLPSGARNAGLAQPDWQFEDVFPRLASHAIETLQTLLRGVPPFFLYLPLTAPHLPIAPSAKFRGSSGLGPLGDFIQEMDAFVGDVIASVRAAGEIENTLIVFASDNGSPGIVDDGGELNATSKRFGFQSNGPWRGAKLVEDHYEGAHRIPLVLHWPGTISPSRIDRTVCLTDLAATFAEVASARPPLEFAEDALSLTPDWTLRPPEKSRPAIVHHSYRGAFGLRQKEWKLLQGAGNKWELYNLADDPQETKDLASADPVRVEQLLATLQDIQQSDRSVT